MKKLVLSSAILAVSCLLPFPSSAQSEPSRDDQALVPLIAPRRVAVGMTRDALKAAAGAPDVMLDATVWVYWDFRVREVPADMNHDALLVVFEKDRVKFFKFTASAPVRAFIARQQGAAAARAVARR